MVQLARRGVRAVPACPVADVTFSDVISVIIPAKDPSQGLDAAVASVLRLLPDAEVIVVDDGSNPPVAEISGARVLRQTNAGPGAARNTGAAAATQGWLLFLDADDELLDGAVVAADIARAGEFGLVCGATVIERAGQTTVAMPSPTGGNDELLRLSATAGAFLVRREVFESAGGYDEELRFGENTDVIARCAALTQVTAIDSVMVKYNAPIDERKYDERRYAAAEHILRRDRHIDGRGRARLHGIAAVNASRVGRYGSSISHSWLAFRAVPSGQSLTRVLIACTGPVGRRWWLRQAR
jgi:glycosyltransferase involved in cell wall biosynthesis